MFQNMSGDDVELEIDELPNEVQHKLLKYVRSIFPRQRESPEEENVDEDYEPERNGKGGGRKKHKPMKKHEQEDRIAALKTAMTKMEGNISAARVDNRPSVAKDESSDDDDSESSEEE